MLSAKGQVLRAFDFSKLDQSNYNEWKRHMRWFLMGEDLWSYVEGSEVKPEDSDVADQVTKWRKGNQRALYFIGTSLESELQEHMDNVEDAKKAWKILKGQFQRVSLMQKYAFESNIINLSFNVEETYTVISESCVSFITR